MPVPVESVSAIFLAAGRSRRYGSENKLLTLIDGRPLVRHSFDTLTGLRFLETILVLGHDATEIEAALTGPKAMFVLNPEYELGIGGSLRLGVQSASLEASGYLIVLADMPFLREESLERMCGLLVGPTGIVVSRSDFLTGSPVLFGSSFRPALEGLTGDRGASRVWQSALESVVYCDVDAGEHRDIDTVDDSGFP